MQYIIRNPDQGVARRFAPSPLRGLFLRLLGLFPCFRQLSLLLRYPVSCRQVDI